MPPRRLHPLLASVVKLLGTVCVHIIARMAHMVRQGEISDTAGRRRAEPWLAGHLRGAAFGSTWAARSDRDGPTRNNLLLCRNAGKSKARYLWSVTTGTWLGWQTKDRVRHMKKLGLTLAILAVIASIAPVRSYAHHSTAHSIGAKRP